MNRLCIGLALLACWLCLPQHTWAQSASPGSLENISTFTLDNGLRVVLLENHSQPQVAFQLWVDVPMHTEKQLAGLSELAGDMLLCGTPGLHRQDIKAAADSLGASLKSDAAGVLITGSSRQKEPMMGLLAELIRKASFPDSVWAQVQADYLKRLSNELGNPREISEAVARVVTYGAAHPYGERPEPPNVKRIRAQDAKAYHAQYFQPAQAYLVMAGDLTDTEARRMAEFYWGNWEKFDAFKEFFPKPEPPISLEVGLVTMSEADSACFELSYPLRLRPGTMDEVRALALSYVFSQRLIKAWPLSHTIADWQADNHVGYFHMSGCSPALQMDSLIRHSYQELLKLRTETVSEQELGEAKSALVAYFAHQASLVGAWADMALKTVRYRLPVDFYPTYTDKIAQISSADLLDIAQSFVMPERANLIVTGPATLAESLKSFSPEKKIRYYDVYGNELQMVGSLLPEALSADDIIQSYMEAIGGIEKLEAVKDLSQHMFTTVQGLEMEMVLLKRAPGQLAIRVSAGDLLINETKFDGQAARVIAMGETQTVDAQGLVDLRDQAYIFPETQYGSKGYTASLVASDVINNTQVYVVDITGPEGISKTEYYDASNWLKVRTVVSRGDITVVNDYADYREVGGILFPHSLISSGLTPQPLQFEIELIEINKQLEDQLFKIQE